MNPLYPEIVPIRLSAGEFLLLGRNPHGQQFRRRTTNDDCASWINQIIHQNSPPRSISRDKVSFVLEWIARRFALEILLSEGIIARTGEDAKLEFSGSQLYLRLHFSEMRPGQPKSLQFATYVCTIYVAS